MLVGQGILTNLNDRELDTIFTMKQQMQEHIFHLEAQIGYDHILRGDTPFYDNTSAVRSIEEYFMEEEDEWVVPEPEFIQNREEIVDFDHTDYYQVVTSDRILFKLGVNGAERINKFLQKLYPN